MQKEDLEALIKLYFDDKLDATGEERLINLLSDNPSEELLTIFDNCLKKHLKHVQFSDTQKVDAWEAIVRRQSLPTQRKRKVYLRFAAVLLAFFTVAAFIHYLGESKEPLLVPGLSQQEDDVYLHQDGALSLQFQDNDGRVRPLSSMEYAQYIIAKQPDETAINFSSFRPTAAVANAKLFIRTDRGQTHQLVLPDGTKVWLNSRTEITIPLDFNQQERHVSLKGEAYFEVAQQSGKLFRVDARYNSTEVLGTHFNIYAYDDEVERTTLLEGKVKVSNAAGETLLNVGEQAYGNLHKPLKIGVDTGLVRSWQQGYFVFNNLTIKELMARVDDWYDIDQVDISYEGNARFSGTFKQSNSLKELLSHLEEISDIKFNIKQGRVHIMK